MIPDSVAVALGIVAVSGVVALSERATQAVVTTGVGILVLMSLTAVVAMVLR